MSSSCNQSGFFLSELKFFSNSRKFCHFFSIYLVTEGFPGNLLTFIVIGKTFVAMITECTCCRIFIFTTAVFQSLLLASCM